jgi:hypothetical protein
MELYLHRLSDNGVSTLGFLEVEIDGFSVYTIEDAPHKPKIYGETRIPAGRYEIKLRTEGKMHEKYNKKYTFHKGMLWLQDVPGFEYILIHIGNRARDTKGCILVGVSVNDENSIAGSTTAYINLYLIVIKAFEKNEQVFINVIDN